MGAVPSSHSLLPDPGQLTFPRLINVNGLQSHALREVLRLQRASDLLFLQVNTFMRNL